VLLGNNQVAVEGLRLVERALYFVAKACSALQKKMDLVIGVRK
jgi:hypothetical protein